MAHEISIRENGFAEMAYVGDLPWHGLGQELTKDSSIEVWAEEAGMDWSIERTPVMFLGNKTFDNKEVLYRTDTQAPLGIITSDYKIVQPREVLEFFRDLISDAGMYLETAGVLFGGKRFWGMANTGQAAKILGNDKIKGNLLFSTSADGTLATNVKFVATRVVCNNTLSIALSESGTNQVRVTHSSILKPESIKQQLGLIDTAWNRFIENVNVLAETTVTEQKARDFVFNLVKKPNLPVEDQPYTVPAMVDNILNRMKNGMGNTGGTAWMLLNGVTEYMDHETGMTRIKDRVFWDSQYGKRSNLKAQAYNQLVEEFVLAA